MEIPPTASDSGAELVGDKSSLNCSSDTDALLLDAAVELSVRARKEIYHTNFDIGLRRESGAFQALE